MPLSHSLCQQVVVSGAPLLVEDAPNDSRVCDNLAVRDLGLVAYTGIPLRDSDGHAIGSFCVIDQAPRAWTDDDIETLSELAMSAMTEIELRGEIAARGQAEAALRAANDRLEAQVEQRTVELTEANTLLKANIDELITAREAALESSRLKSEFLATISHEIRTPMTGVIGMNELLFSTELTSVQAEYAGIVRESANALLTIINDILDFSKIEAGKLTVNLSEFDPRTLVESAARVFSAKAHSQNLALMTLVEPEIAPRLHGDPDRLRQVLLNLVGNAVKFTERGEVVVRAAVESETATHTTVRFSVTDSGIGLSESARRRLFSHLPRRMVRWSANTVEQVSAWRSRKVWSS
jgi:signal transduction histidine kinase